MFPKEIKQEVHFLKKINHLLFIVLNNGFLIYVFRHALCTPPLTKNAINLQEIMKIIFFSNKQNIPVLVILSNALFWKCGDYQFPERIFYCNVQRPKLKENPVHHLWHQTMLATPCIVLARFSRATLTAARLQGKSKKVTKLRAAYPRRWWYGIAGRRAS